ncbi:MAG: AAA family ATPase [Methylophilaceae bacterium]|nr:AAA family ATPase [Methylophilaceae bacterium]
MPRTLAFSDLDFRIDPDTLGFGDTSELVDDAPVWIGQERAEKAARFGLTIDHPDYNLFVLGEAGSGRSSLLFRAMQEAAAQRPPAPDLVYLHNFEQPEKPLALRLRPGQGSVLRQCMEAFVRDVTVEIPRKLDEEGFRLDCARVRKAYQAEMDRAYAELASLAAAWNYVLRREDGRLVFNLMDKNGQAMSEEALLAMTPDQRMVLEHAEAELRAAIGDYLETIRPKERAMEQALTDLRRQAVQPLLDQHVHKITEALAGQVEDATRLQDWLGLLCADVLDNLEVFSPVGGGGDFDHERMEELLKRYRVNVVVDNGGMARAPVLRDDDPVFRSLFGGIEYQAENGVLLTDFTRIRAGNLLRAHGGFLMLHLRDLLREPQVWEKLRRFLRNGGLQIEEPAATLGQLAATTLEPEVVEVRVKIVLIGSREEYYDLQEVDPEFFQHFRVKVDFAESFPADTMARRATALFVAQTCRRLGLPHFDAAAVASLLQEMQRELGDRRRQSALFGRLEAWLVESATQCVTRGGRIVSVQDVEAARQARIARHNYPEQRLHESIAEGEIMIRTSGREVGQINGLTQIDLGDYCFGSPVRISARVYAGDDGIINIDREVEMSGPNHDKGVFILQNWLAATFTNMTPLCLTASLVFEQEYHGVEGDSASCAELFALISALSGLPLPQGIAVTGALNQYGEVLPVGGINEKIEGYFRVCRRIGLDGKQGVIIPARNCGHLLLDREVVAAVEAGQFGIYTIDNVCEGLEILTGMAAGVPDEMGNFRPDTVLGRVQKTLEAFRKACEAAAHARDREH